MNGTHLVDIWRHREESKKDDESGIDTLTLLYIDDSSGIKGSLGCPLCSGKNKVGSNSQASPSKRLYTLALARDAFTFNCNICMLENLMGLTEH